MIPGMPSPALCPLALLGILCAAAAQAPSDTAGRPPNIVLLFSDDAGYADFGFQPQAAADLAKRTPHIDSIARQGLRFSNAYMSAAVCSPSRAGLLSGRYQQRFGHERNIPPGYMAGGMDLGQRTVADRLKRRGYTTGLVGKWHLGYPPAYHPNNRGFDWFYGLLQGSRAYRVIARPSAHRVIQENGRPTPERGYVTDRFGDAALRFIAEHKARPFFLFVSFTSPHGPLQAKPADLEQLQDVSPQRRRRFVGLVKNLDDNVGRILAALDSHGLREDTLVVFTNDNGGQTQVGADNGPLRGRKGTLYEGGVRVPMCMRWPGKLQAGGVIDEPVISLDLLPTFLALSGQPLPASAASDGIDLSVRLLGRQDRLPTRDLFWRGSGREGPVAMRRGRHKLVASLQGGARSFALYDLETDLGEQKDLAAAQPEMLAELRKALATWEGELIEPRWSPGRRRGQQGSRRRKR